MEENQKKTVIETLKTRFDTPWVCLVIVLTLGLTVLFYFSQKPQIVIYSQYLKSLSEFQLLESNLRRSMDAVRVGAGYDTLQIQSQIMTLREMAVSFSREVDETNIPGISKPSYGTVLVFERTVLSKLATMRSYMAARIAWFEKFYEIKNKMLDLDKDVLIFVNNKMDSAQIGFPVQMAPMAELDSLRYLELDSLFKNNEELAQAWSKFDNDIVFMRSADIAQFYQNENLDEISLKSKIPMIFYLLSLVLLLSTFFFLFRSKY